LTVEEQAAQHAARVQEMAAETWQQELPEDLDIILSDL